MNISDLPNLRLVTCDTSRREPGMMVFNVRPGGSDGGTAAGWIIGIDQGGEVVLHLKYDAPTQDVRLHPQGNISYFIDIANCTTNNQAGPTVAGRGSRQHIPQ